MRSRSLLGLLWCAMIAIGCATANTGGDDDDDDDIVAFDADPNQPDGLAAVDAAPNTPDALPLGTPCDAILQDCGPGQKCALIVTNVGAQTGFPGCWSNGDKGIGVSCTSAAMVDTADDCIAGSHCVFGTCHEICKLDTAACSDGGCVGVNNLESQFDICLPSCDPLASTCIAGEGCYMLAQGSVCAPVIGAGVAPHGACDSPNECAAGSGCFNTPGECLAYCDFSTYANVNDPGHCDAGEVCGGITDEPIVGVCVIP